MARKTDASMPRSKFLKVKCGECGGEQVIFGCASRTVNCQVCGKELAKPTGGKTRVLTKITKVLE